MDQGRQRDQVQDGRARTSASTRLGIIASRCNTPGRAALRWWRDRCVAWCSVEPNGSVAGFGDQAHLAGLVQRFDGVRVARDPRLALAPWNLGAHRVHRRGDELLLDEEPLVLHHFQSLRLRRTSPASRVLRGIPHRRPTGQDGLEVRAQRGWRPRAEDARLLYDPYARALGRAATDVLAVCPAYERELPRTTTRELREDLSRMAGHGIYVLLGRVLPPVVRSWLSDLRLRRAARPAQVRAARAATPSDG